MAKASILPQALTPTYQNLSPIAQEISSGEMSGESLKKWQLVKPDAAPRGDSSYIFYFKDQINTQNEQNTSNIEECIPPKRGKHCHREPSAGLSQQLQRQFYCLSGKFNVLWPSLRDLATTPPSVMSSVTSSSIYIICIVLYSRWHPCDRWW